MRTLLLVGSSIMEGWQDPGSIAPDWKVVNRAVGGTTTSYWVEHLAEVLEAGRPDAVFAYVGSNDIASGVSVKVIGEGIRVIRSILRDRLPSVRFAYCSIIKAPQRLGRFHEIAAANAAARAALLPGDLWLDSDPVFLDRGAPVARYYVEDGLHLNAGAYRALTASIRPDMERWLAGRP